METLLFYYLYCYLCISSVGAFPGFPYNPWFLCLNTMLPWFLRAVTHVVHDGGGAGRGGFPWLDRRRPEPCTCFYPGVQFNLPDQFPILDTSPYPITAGTGDPRSADHPWVGSSNGDSSIYPPPYLRKGFFHFLCHDSDQLIEND